MSLRWPAWLVPEDLVVVLDDPSARLQTNGVEPGLLRVPRTPNALAQLDVVDGDGPVGVRAPSPSGAALLERLAYRPGPAPVLVEAYLDRPNLTLSVYTVPFYRTLDEPLRLGVDERLADAVARRAGTAFDAVSAADWLTTQFVAATPRGGGMLLASHVDPGRDLAGGLQVHARDATIHLAVRTEDRALLLERIVPPAPRSPRLEDTLQLIEGDIAFVEDTYASKVAALRRAMLAGTGAEAAAAPTSRYLQVWERYEEESMRRVLAQGRRFGTVRYTAAEARSPERWDLVLASAADAERVSDRTEGFDALAIHERRPQWLDVDPGATALQQALQHDGGVVQAEILDVRDGVVVVKVETRDERTVPPSGLLAASLAGHVAQAKRRTEARAQLGAHPDLELVLADHNVDLPGARRRRLPRELSEPVKRIFGGRDPNNSQRRALELAYEIGGLVAIQGPPGTGKTSVVAALEQLYADDPSGRARNAAALVSASQHDAVEHVLDRSSVFGLPPIKHGRRRGEERAADSRTSEWALARAHNVDERLAAMEGGKLADAVVRLSQRGRSYLAVARPANETGRLLRDLADATAGDATRLLSPPLRDALLDAAADLERDAERALAATGRRDATLRRAAALLRTTATAFDDDGRRTVATARALLRGGEVLNADADELLTRAGRDDKADFGALAALRDAILDELAASPALARRALRDDRATALISDALDELEARLRETPDGRAQALVRYRDSLREDVVGLETTLTRYLTVVGATTQQSATLDQLFNEDVEFRVVVVDEAARAQPLDLLIPLVRAKESKVVVGDHRQLPQLVDQELAGRIGTTKGMTDQELLEMSLFERLYKRLERSGRAVTLNEQYRMHPIIGAFVSDTFYPEGEQFRSPRPAEDFAHGLRQQGYAGRVVRWLNVAPSREQRSGRSVSRPAEADAIVQDLVLLMEDRPELSFGLIAMYSAQVQACWTALEAVGLAEHDGDGWRVTEEYRYCRAEDGAERTDELGQWVHRLRVGTVDAFQGREFDVVFVSLVRSNDHDDPRRRFGFTLTPNRLNVAVSRAKRLLVVAGDWKTFGVDTPDTAAIRAFHALCTRHEADL